MGIPHYFRIIAQTYPGIVGLVQPPTDHIFFDFNGAIHQSAKKVIDNVKNKSTVINIADLYGISDGVEEMDAGCDLEKVPAIEKEIMEAVETYLRDLVKYVKPKKGAYIYMDGVAPHAKLIQQRKRRYLSLLRHKLLHTDPIWDTNAISPGTLFMIRLAGFLRTKLRNNPLGAEFHTRYSFSDENGEAEHKIFASMTSIPRDEKILIHGLDADLIMLALLSHRPNITLMREPHDGADFQFLNIDRLREGILKELATKYMWPIEIEKDNFKNNNEWLFNHEACDAIESYVVWCFFLGNDFLPHLPTLHLQKNGLEKILASSQYTMLVNSANSTIDWDVMYRILEELSVEENDVMFNLISENIRRKCHAKTDEEKVDMYPLLEENKSELVMELYNRSGGINNTAWRSLYYKKLFHTRLHDLSVITEACREYMTGIEWTYRYYKRLSRDSTWYYPYSYAPTMADLMNHISIYKEKHRIMIEYWKTNFEIPTFIPDYVQLLCILPPESEHLIPAKLRDIIRNPELGCTHMYPKKYPIHTFLKTRLWECTPVLPALNIDLLQKNAMRLITQIDKIKPRSKLIQSFANGFHIAK